MKEGSDPRLPLLYDIGASLIRKRQHATPTRACTSDCYIVRTTSGENRCRGAWDKGSGRVGRGGHKEDKTLILLTPPHDIKRKRGAPPHSCSGPFSPVKDRAEHGGGHPCPRTPGRWPLQRRMPPALHYPSRLPQNIELGVVGLPGPLPSSASLRAHATSITHQHYFWFGRRGRRLSPSRSRACTPPT